MARKKKKIEMIADELENISSESNEDEHKENNSELQHGINKQDVQQEEQQDLQEQDVHEDEQDVQQNKHKNLQEQYYSEHFEEETDAFENDKTTAYQTKRFSVLNTIMVLYSNFKLNQHDTILELPKSYKDGVFSVLDGEFQQIYPLFFISNDYVFQTKDGTLARLVQLYKPWYALLMQKNKHTDFASFMLGAASAAFPRWCIGIPHGIVIAYMFSRTRPFILLPLLLGVRFYTYSASVMLGILCHACYKKTSVSFIQLISACAAYFFSLVTCAPCIQQITPCVLFISMISV